MTTYATYFHLPAGERDMPINGITTTHSALKMPHPENSMLEITDPLLHTQRDPVSASHNAPHITSQQSKSPFFRLPAELRNKIYKALLCPDTSSLKEMVKQTAGLSVHRFIQASTKTSLYPTILSTCRRVHSEAYQMLYTAHTFHAHPSLLTSLPHLYSASKPVLYSHLTALITCWQVCLRLDTDPLFTFAQATKAFSGAEYLEVRVWQAQFESCDYAVLKLLAGVRGVKFARVGGSVDEKVAKSLEELMMRPLEGKEDGSDGCDKTGCAVCVEWESGREVLCGRCYKKLGAA
jgi:hypothetical protein